MTGMARMCACGQCWRMIPAMNVPCPASRSISPLSGSVTTPRYSGSVARVGIVPMTSPSTSTFSSTPSLSVPSWWVNQSCRPMPVSSRATTGGCGGMLTASRGSGTARETGVRPPMPGEPYSERP